jgi:hypothetical protein
MNGRNMCAYKISGRKPRGKITWATKAWFVIGLKKMDCEDEN